jgi:DNA modification methylase
LERMKACNAEGRHGDCAEVLREYPENTFDLIVTSPPYAAIRHVVSSVVDRAARQVHKLKPGFNHTR